jgi:hypothetical protein
MSGSRTPQIGIVLLALAIVPFGQAQDKVVVPLISTTDWRLVRSESPNPSAPNSFETDQAVDREYGVQRLELRHYQLGTRRAEALLKEAPDPTAAYGLLTYYRTEDMTPEKGLDWAFIGPSSALMERGRVCIHVRSTDGSELTRGEIRSLMIAIGGARLSRDEGDSFPAPLPTAGLMPHTEKYLLGPETARRVLPSFRTDLIGFTQGAEARVGTYSTAAGNSTVIAVNYPTPQIARIRYGAMESLLRLNMNNVPGAIYGKRGGSFVFLVLGSNSSGAEKLLNQFQVKSEVSWNERTPEPERFAMDLAKMILSIILLVMVIVIIAVVTGVLMVLSRRVARRFFPGSEWANPGRDRVIRLNL